MPSQQLALLAIGIEQDKRLAFGQGLTHPQYPGLQRGLVTVVGAVAGDEVLDQPVKGVGRELVIRDKQG